jgi:hypothetical protein
MGMVVVRWAGYMVWLNDVVVLVVCSCGCVEQVMERGSEKQMAFILSVRFCAPGRKSHTSYSKSNGGWWVYSYHRW